MTNTSSAPVNDALASDTAIPTIVKFMYCEEERCPGYTFTTSPTVAFRSRAALSFSTASVSLKADGIIDPDAE